MELTLNKAVTQVELSGIRQFTYLVRDTPGACALTIGEPDLNTPSRPPLKPPWMITTPTIPPATAIHICWRPSPGMRRSTMASPIAPARSS